MNSAVPSAAMRPTVSSASSQMNRVGTRVGPIGARSARAIPRERCFHGRRIADHQQVLFDGFAGNAVARQTVPHPLPVFGEQPLPGVRIEQFLVMARPVRLLEIPLRIAEEAATLDHVSKGRLIFGVGRSGVVKTYEALNIANSESKDREIECLEIIQRAWREDNFSYKGKFYDIQEVTVVPQPVQQPAPEIRIAAVSVETFPAAGEAGQGLFLSVRHEDVRMFKQHIDVYRKAWTDAGHPGEAPVYLRCPGFVAKTDAAAQEAYGPTLMRHFQNQSRLLADSSRRQNSPPDHPRWKTSQRLTEITLEETLRGSVFIGSPDTVVGKLKDLQRDIGLSGVHLETNCAGLADHGAEREAIRLLAREVKSAFR